MIHSLICGVPLLTVSEAHRYQDILSSHSDPSPSSIITHQYSSHLIHLLYSHYSVYYALYSEYALLSTAVPDLSTLGQNVNDRWEVPHLCQAGFSER